MTRFLPAFALIAVLALPSVALAEDPLKTGLWRGEIDQYGTTIPFQFEVVEEADGRAVFLINGPERMRVEELDYKGGTSFGFEFPSYSAWLRGEVSEGMLTGTVHFERGGGVTHDLPVTAEHGVAWRFHPEPAEDYADVAGTWETTIRYPDLGFDQKAIGHLQQEGPYVFGTFETQVGDFRYIAGEVRGNELMMSSYDGGYSQLWRGTLDADGNLAGIFASTTYLEAEWEARRNPEARLEDPESLTYLKEGAGQFAFTFPDLEGNPVSLDDPQFQNKVVLVTLGGSWCPSCHDEAAFLGPIYEQYKADGLEIIQLMFEYSAEFSEVERQVRAFQRRYDISYPMLFAGTSKRQMRGEALPQLNTIYAFPTTIFIDRAGEVRSIHTAFPGPATGEKHRAYARNFRALVERLLAEPAPG